MTKPLLHQHIIIRAEVASPPIDADAMKEWLEILIKDIGMKVLIGPFGVYSTMVGNRGLTVGAIIETSHVVMHTWDECSPAIVMLDVYTCSELDVNVVFDHMKLFKPTKMSWKFLDREHDLVVVSSS